MYGMVFSTIMICKVVNLGMAIMACRNAVIRVCGNDLVVLDLAVFPSCIRVSGLQKAPASSATVIVRFVGVHVYEVFLSYNRLHDEAQIIGDSIPKALSYDLTRILNRKFDF